MGHYIFCSTVAVYPPTELAPVDEGFPVDRGPEASQYAMDKIACEDMVMEAFTGRRFPATVIRPSYVYGPGNYQKQWEYSYFARLTQRRKIILPGDGAAFVHHVHVEDLAASFLAARGNSKSMGQIYTVCGNEAITADGYIRTIGEVMGWPPRLCTSSTAITKR